MPFVATLIAHPRGNPIESRLAEACCEALQSPALYWLGDGEACDIPVPQTSDIDPSSAQRALNILRSIIDTLPIDVVVQDQDNRRKRVLIADMDSTMIDQECIDELAAEAGFKDQVSAITARAMNGEIEFEPALRERVRLLKGLPVSVISRVLGERITLAAGGPELVATMKANGAYTALVSGGFTAFTSVIAGMLRFDEHRANVLIDNHGMLTGQVASPILGRQAKVEAVLDIAAASGLAAQDFIAVGDGANDLGMLQLAGSGVALHAKPSVAAAAPHRIDHGDLTALLYMQGYRKTDFVT